MSDEQARCGFVALLGPPNAGKSTLVNALVGTKVSIVSPKVQTTRSRVLGIALSGPSQVIFVDTPGIFEPRRRLDRAMVRAAWSGAADADRSALVIDSHRGYDDNARAIISGLKERKGIVDLVLNKIDLVRRDSLLEMVEKAASEQLFDKIFMISALTGDGVNDLMTHFAGLMPMGPWHFPEDQVSDMPMRLLAAEITREQAFNQLHQELPYATWVETDMWTEKKDGSARIDQTIYVARESQRAIVLGKGGQKIRSIGAKARIELEQITERRIHLFLHVKVRENWLEERSVYNNFGLEYDV